MALQEIPQITSACQNTTAPSEIGGPIRRYCGFRRIDSFVYQIKERSYYCPEYVPGQSISLQNLPSEILLQIITQFNPSTEIRALRYIRKVTENTPIRWLRDAVDEILTKQRCAFLEGKRPELCKPQFRLERHKTNDTLRQFVGKQFVCEAEDIEGDPWVSWNTVPTALPILVTLCLSVVLLFSV